MPRGSKAKKTKVRTDQKYRKIKGRVKELRLSPDPAKPQPQPEK